MANRQIPPHTPGMYRMRVLSSERISPSFQRVTATGPELERFGSMGFDQWFRLFFREPHQKELTLTTAVSSLWYPEWLALTPSRRPHCANYTVREFRAATSATPASLDIDFVIHRGTSSEPGGGQLEGGAAIWATSVTPGEEFGILDQGLLFAPPADVSEVHLVADESGLPAVEGILRSLPAETRGSAVVEVPVSEDIRALHGPGGMPVTWVTRDVSAKPGQAALTALQSRAEVDDLAYAFVVGESSLATAGRRHLHSVGLAKHRITFSGFWKSSQHAPRRRTSEVGATSTRPGIRSA